MILSIPFDKYPALISGGKVFDPIRKKWLEATPEELVRQHLIQYLILEKKYPAALIKMEHPLQLNTLQKRSDLVVYNRDGKAAIVIECKAPDVKLNDDVLLQILRYNILIKAPYLILCNGVQCLCFYNSEPQHQLPDYNQL